MFRSSWFYLLVLGLGLLTLGLVVRSGILAVKNPGEPINAAMRAAMAAEQPELSTEQALEIDRLYPTAHVLTSGLRYLVLDPGRGDRTPRIADEVAVKYTGSLLGGAVFDSSDRHGGIFTFHAGLGDVIKGWDEAVLQMKKGERRRLIIPWWLAYGDAGKPPVIPPKAVLVFDIELVDFR
ncbi:MAG TPA: FKBP-type peptidyl-prolyl cis-trans isomerase [Opitutaceae bacterium]|nr:FKBP-type peptidyl-prolyl cis-trans isomerase [Opitutaceae bacterium]